MNNIDLYNIDSFISACLFICLISTKADSKFPRENIAFRKSVFQSSIYQELDGRKAVDGRYEQTFTKCSHGKDEAGGRNWLVVDLEDAYHIHEVILTPRRETPDTLKDYEYSNRETPARMQYVYIGVTNGFVSVRATPVRHTYPLCRQWPYKTNISQNLTITCRPNTPPGRHLIVQQPINGPGSLTMCEIQIFGKKLKQESGKCQNGYYGELCDKQCNCYKQVSCDKSNGTCQSGCDENWEGESCNKRRTDYTKIIVGCFDMRVNHKEDILTPRYTTCLDQCSGNGFNFASIWNETSCYCTNYIDWSTSRENCKTSCFEEVLNGCLNLNSRFILSVCPNGTYGYNCTLKCNCLNNGRCSYLNGSCDQGCKPGWTGETCDVRDCSSYNGGCEKYETCISNSSDVSSCYCNNTFFSRMHVWSTCEEIDECQINSSCNVDEVCYNFEGGHECISKAVGLNEVIYIVIAIAGILLLLVVALLIMKFIRRHKLNEKPYYSSKVNSSDYVASSSSGAPPKVSELYLEDFPSYVAEKKNLFAKEFKELPVFDYPTEFAQKQPKSLNRFKNIVPYDKNRVKVKSADEETSDYINASYIKNVLQSTLIATQGPTKDSVESFWRMIWQENIGIIVMLCNLVEMAKIKCVEYWPMMGSNSYGDITITYINSHDWPEYKVTHLILEKEGFKQEITHFHYTTWPDHDAPKYHSYFLAFIRHFRKVYLKQKSGVVVHCSAGVGRTGSFIAITDLLTRGLAGKPINVSGCVSKLRESRMKMVEKEVQFGFIYDCLAEEATLGQMNFDPQDFQIFFSDRKKFRKKMENQYQRLQTLFGKGHFKERNFIEVVTSTRKFHLIQQTTVNEFWAEIPEECDLVIVFGEHEEYFPESNHPVDTETFVISLVSQEMDTNAKIFHLQMSEKNYSNTYANIAIYDNDENLANAVSKKLSAILVQSKDMEAIMNYPMFNELFRIMKPNSLTAVMSSYERLAGFFMTSCNILDQLTSRNEVAIFQNVLEIQSDRFHYNPTLDDYEKLHELVIEYLQEETHRYG